MFSFLTYSDALRSCITLALTTSFLCMGPMFMLATGTLHSLVRYSSKASNEPENDVSQQNGGV
jgi:hypothetical protein